MNLPICFFGPGRWSFVNVNIMDGNPNPTNYLGPRKNPNPQFKLRIQTVNFYIFCSIQKKFDFHSIFHAYFSLD